MNLKNKDALLLSAICIAVLTLSCPTCFTSAVQAQSPTGTVGLQECPEGFAETAGDVWATNPYDPATEVRGTVKILPNNGSSWQDKPGFGDSGWVNMAINNNTGEIWAINHWGSWIKKLPYNGTSWQDMPTFPASFQGSYGLAVNSSTGDVWAMEYNGSVLMLPNGSSSWIDMPDPGNDAWGTWYNLSVNSSTGEAWAINSYNGSVKMLTNNGTSWQNMPAISGNDQWCQYGISVNSNTGEVWALRGDGMVMMLPKNGLSWETKPAVGSAPSPTAWFDISVNSNTGEVWAISTDGAVWMLPKDGLNWQERPAPGGTGWAGFFVVAPSCKPKVTYRFDGFLQPINDTAHQQLCGSPCPYSIFKGGSTVPVKFRLKDANGNVTQAASPPMWLTPEKVGPMSGSIQESLYGGPAIGGTTFRWADNQYIYNWSTKGLATGYFYRIGVQLDDGQTYTVDIGLR
jgi:hypothetical protein